MASAGKADRFALVGAGCLTFAVLFGGLVAFGAYREREAAEAEAETQRMAAERAQQARADAGPPAERRCRILRGATAHVTLEFDGGTVQVLRGSYCALLATDAARSLVRVTEGESSGTEGWLPSSEVGIVGTKLW
jgi:hypothetical protein